MALRKKKMRAHGIPDPASPVGLPEDVLNLPFPVQFLPHFGLSRLHSRDIFATTAERYFQ